MLLFLFSLLSHHTLLAQITAAEASEIDGVFAPWANASEPGVVAGIIKDGEVVYLKGFGSANMENPTPITPQTKFQLGEMSKQFTSLAIFLLEKDGKISLQDDVRKYLPELPVYENKITIGHLLNHSSGLNGIEQVSNMITGTTNVPTQAKALNLIAAQKELTFKPGTDFSFHESKTESILMAEIVARSSGQSFADFVKTNVFDPLGMVNSLIRDDSDAMLTNVAEPYRKEEDTFKRNQVRSSVVGAINAYSSAEDLAKWYLNFTHPKGPLGLLIQKLDTPVKLANGKKYAYYWGDMAIGREFTHPERGLPIFWHFGIQGGYGTNVFRYLDQNITSFVLGNNNQYNGSLAMGAIDVFVKDLYLLPSVIDYQALETKKLSTKSLASFEGHYWFQKAGYASRIFIENDTLRNQWLFTKRFTTLIPISDNTFQQVGLHENIRLYNFKNEAAGMKLYFTFNESVPDIMERYEPVIPSVQTLKSYAGTYYNKAYASLFTVAIEDEKLIVKNIDHEGIEFRPVKKDVFTSTSAFLTALEFLRGGSNEIRGFKVDADGIHHLTYEKLPSFTDQSN